MKQTPKHGFTLVEMSIVLVIIGLIIGGVLVGLNLVQSAAVRSTIAQIAAYNSAVSTFRAKYNGIPGDLTPTAAAAGGFTSRAGGPGFGNGDEYLGVTSGTAAITIFEALAMTSGATEPKLFWVDLGTAGMMNGNFNPTAVCVASSPTVTTDPANCVPTAKIGQGSFIYAWGYQGLNYFLLSGISSNIADESSNLGLPPTLTVAQAFNIDSKIDDGLPETGQVTAQELGYETMDGTTAKYNIWLAGDGGSNDVSTSTSPSPTSCYDDRGVVGGTRKYSMQLNNGAHTACALAFQFGCQGGC